ncbi:MAG: T9SS type A sorting domain-containing protein [Bacteroidales bacterium]|nr:T9SS type A sorting domain-containing protein [Bacteroidales bacterium]
MIKKLLILAAVLFIFKTQMGQAVWTQQNTNFTDYTTAIGVDQVSVVDENIVWVRGFNGTGSGPALKTFSRTNNGGTSWTSGHFTQLGATEMPYVLGASSYTTAYVIVMDTVSYATSLWGTTDGGTTWVKKTTMYVGASSFANGVRFWDTQKGFCHGDPLSGIYEIYTTNDGGTTWTPNANAPAPVPVGEFGFNGYDCMALVPGGIGFIMTDHARVLRTTDYGATWAPTPTPPFTSDAYGSNKIYASSANYIICAAYTTATTTWSWKYTTDGGTVWNNYAPTGPFYDYSMCYVPGSFNMFVATSPYSTMATGVAYSNDGGLSWTDFTDPLLQPLGTNTQCLGVGFASQQVGWVGNYDQNGAINSILKFQDLTAGKNDICYVNGNDVNMYPNPSEGVVNFSVNGTNDKRISINVYDLVGHIVFSDYISTNGTNVTNFDFSPFAKGMYVVNFQSDNDNITQKLIIK